MNHNQTKDIIKSIAKQEQLTIAEVREALEAAPGLIAEVIRSSSRKELYFPSIRIPGWGLFHCPDWKKEQLKRVNEKK